MVWYSNCSIDDHFRFCFRRLFVWIIAFLLLFLFCFHVFFCFVFDFFDCYLLYWFVLFLFGFFVSFCLCFFPNSLRYYSNQNCLRRATERTLRLKIVCVICWLVEVANLYYWTHLGPHKIVRFHLMFGFFGWKYF